MSHNMFAYCNNDPVNNEDSDGFYGHALRGGIPATAIRGLVLISMVAAQGLNKLSSKNISISTSKSSKKKIGVIYERTNIHTGKRYIGQAKSSERFLMRQKEHERKYRKENNIKSHKPNYRFRVIDRKPAGKQLRIAEQKAINRYGGIAKLENKRNAVRPSKWKQYGIRPPK